MQKHYDYSTKIIISLKFMGHQTINFISSLSYRACLNVLFRTFKNSPAEDSKHEIKDEEGTDYDERHEVDPRPIMSNCIFHLWIELVLVLYGILWK